MENRTLERKRMLRREMWAKRKKKIKIVSLFLIILFFFFGMYQFKKGVSNYLWNLETFKLQNINVFPENVSPIITEIVTIERGKNLLFFPLSELQEKISQLRIVERCRIKKIFPSTIEIEIEVRKPWVEIETGKSPVFIDTTGIVVPPPENGTNYIKIYGLNIENYSVSGKDLNKIKILREIEKWYNSFNIANTFEILTIDLSDLEKIVLKNNEKLIYIRNENIEEKFENLKIILAECESKNFTWQYIDLRFENPYVKKK